MSSEYYFKNKEKCSEWSKIYYFKNKERINERNRIYYKKNKLKINDNAKVYTQKRKLFDENFKNRRKFHNKLQVILRGLREKKVINNNFNFYLGCKTEEFQSHIEKLFKSGMTWENYGKDGWHIDHVIPKSKFNLIDDEEIKKCFNYSNLQPLWEFENRIKGNKS